MFFPEIKKSNNRLEPLINKLSKYDIYDVLLKISAVSLLPNNQNKNMLFAELINGILCKEKSFYKSKTIIGYSEFKDIIMSLNDLNTELIDPNEMPFVDHISFYGNKWIFPGINLNVNYNLQMLLNSIYLRNDFDEDFKEKVRCLAGFTLEVSTSVAKGLGYSYDSIKHYETEKIDIPTKKQLFNMVNQLVISSDFLQYYTFDYDFSHLLFSEFKEGKAELGKKDYPFFERPFLMHPSGKFFIILDVSILSTFTIKRIVEISENLGLKTKLFDVVNRNVFRDCLKSLNKMNHNIIKHDDFEIVLKDAPEYKEKLLNLSNDGLMLVKFFCDDGTMFNPNKNDRVYFNDVKKHNNRLKNILKKISVVDDKNAYQIVIVFSFLGDYVFATNRSTKTLIITPYDLKCLSINERGKGLFIKRFLDAKSKLLTVSPLNSDLDLINVFVENGYSFYIDDDNDYRTCSLFIGLGDTVDFRNKAILSQKLHLASYPNCKHYKEVVLEDKDRNIFISVADGRPLVFELLVEFSNKKIWVVSEEIESIKQVDVTHAFLDMISYWLSECHNYIEKKELIDSNILIKVHLDSKLYEGFDLTSIKDSDNLESIIIKKGKNIIDVTFNDSCFSIFSKNNNEGEKQFISLLLKEMLLDPDEYNYSEISKQFDNPLKKKIHAFEISTTPYIEPVSHKPVLVSKAYMDCLLDEIGDYFRITKEIPYGDIPTTNYSELYKDTVEFLYQKLLQHVKKFDAQKLIELVYFDLEAIMYNSMISQRNYAYTCACYPEKEEKIIDDYNELNATSISLKFLLELVSSIQPKGSEQISYYEYENMLTICYAIITYAYDSDLSHYNIATKELRILNSGRIAFKGEGEDYVAKVSLSAAQSRLDMISNPNKLHFSNSELVNTPIEEINDAFIEEYNYSFEAFTSFINLLIDLGKTLNSDIKNVNYEHLVDKASKELNLEPRTVKKIIDSISLQKRDNYLVPPEPFVKEDVYPWRFNRGLSFTKRPLIILSNGSVIWGNRQLDHMWRYTIDLIEEGKYKARSKKLEVLIGKIANKRGNAFNDRVYSTINENNNLIVKKKVSKINKKKLCKSNGDDLGDIDVLVINSKKKTITVCEVKDFSFAKSPYEIYLEYNKLFIDKGKNLCYISKHKRRVDWIKKNIEDVLTEYKLKPGKWIVKDALIVSNEIQSNQIYHKNQRIITYSELTDNQSFF